MDIGDGVSISTIISHRDCPRRMSWQRSVKEDCGCSQDPNCEKCGGTGQVRKRRPGTDSYAAAYGSALHDCIEYVEKHDCDDDTAIWAIFKRYSEWLEPADIDRLRQDLKTYHERDYLGVRTIASEIDQQVFLFSHNGRPVYFRFRLDRLYERLDTPGHFIHIDYKTGKWRKTEDEVHSDIQMWAYNWAIHELWPECERLDQVYDQLRHGTVITHKTDDQRGQMKEWLILEAQAIIDNDDYGPDGLLQPRLNQWCPYCPILESCPIVAELSDFALAEIATLAPVVKEGRKLQVQLDPTRFQDYVKQLASVELAEKVLDRFKVAVRGVLKELPADERSALGFDVQERSQDVWRADALRQIHNELGDDFYELIRLPKTTVSEALKDDPRLEGIFELASKEYQNPVVVRRRRKEQ